MAEYLLTPHTYFCITDDHAVFLDLRRDKYIGVSRAQMRALSACVRGWPAASAEPVAGGESEPDSIVGKMLAAGMLTTDDRTGKRAELLSVEPPESTLTHPDLDARPSVRFREVVTFFRSTLQAAAIFRLRRIESVVTRVRTRKMAALARGAGVEPDLARELVAAYLHLRPLLYGARDKCLFDSFALTEFLARYNVFATWVFGVQTGPFNAHCWVQHGKLVFNDTPEHVRRYTPILAV